MPEFGMEPTASVPLPIQVLMIKRKSRMATTVRLIAQQIKKNVEVTTPTQAQVSGHFQEYPNIEILDALILHKTNPTYTKTRQQVLVPRLP
jgi:hypothetical protein